MQKAETGTLEQPKKEIHVTKLAEVSVDAENKIYVNWPTDKKELVITGLAEAIKLVANYKANIVEKADPSLMDFIKGVKK